MATKTAHSKARRDSREAFRLWFEFLRRAIAEDKSKVRLDLYAEWGDVTAYKSFDAWWREVGVHLIHTEPQTLEHVAEGVADDGCYLVRVPKTMTSTQMGNEVRKYFIALGHVPQKASSLRVTEGKEIRPVPFRAYLHTYDQQRKLVERADGKKVTAKDVLVAVRKFYLEREEKWKKSGRKVDTIPSSIVDGMDGSNIDEAKWLDSPVAINTINRYLKNARAIIEAVKVGRFPE
jgi:hypothetical protein